MSAIDTSEGSVEAWAVAVEEVAAGIGGLSKDGLKRLAGVLRKLRDERNEARAAVLNAALAGADAILDNDDRLLGRPDIAAILRGEAVAVPVDALPEMLAAWWRQKNTGTQEVGKIGHEISDSAAYRAMLAASPYAPKET